MSKKPYFCVFLVKIFQKLPIRGILCEKSIAHIENLENASQIMKYQIVAFSGITEEIAFYTNQ